MKKIGKMDCEQCASSCGRNSGSREISFVSSIKDGRRRRKEVGKIAEKMRLTRCLARKISGAVYAESQRTLEYGGVAQPGPFHPHRQMHAGYGDRVAVDRFGKI